MGEENRKHNNRILWIDVLKGILIILVVFGHNIQFGSGNNMLSNELYFENSVFRFIYSFHMPCLMALSGFFFGLVIDRKDMWRRRIQTLLFPTLIWSLVPAGITFIFALLRNELTSSLILKCIRLLVSYYWFLWAIVFGSLAVWIIHKFFRDSIVFFTILGIGFLFFPERQIVEMWFFMYPFFVAGYLWNLKKPNVRWLKEHIILIVIILIAVFAVLFVFYNTDSFIYTTGIVVRSISQLKIDIYRYTIGFIGSAMIISLVYVLNSIFAEKIQNMLAYCGRISLTIYIIDSLLNSFVIPRLTKHYSFNYGIVFIETIIVVLFCIMVDWIIKKFPTARKMLLGSR